MELFNLSLLPPIHIQKHNGSPEINKRSDEGEQMRKENESGRKNTANEICQTITTDTQEHRRTHTMHSVTESEHGGVVNCVKNGRKV